MEENDRIAGAALDIGHRAAIDFDHAFGKLLGGDRHGMLLQTRPLGPCTLKQSKHDGCLPVIARTYAHSKLETPQP
jgi:hypothetical protein